MDVIGQLRAAGEERLATILRARPVLVDYCGSLPELARFIESPYAVSEALCHTNAFQHAAAEVIAALGPVHLVDAAAALALPQGEEAALAAAIVHLQELLLVVGQQDGRWSPGSGVARHFGRPLGLGPPLAAMAAQVDVGALRRAAVLLGRPTAGSKAVLVAAISDALSDAETVQGALVGAPPGTPALFARLAKTGVADVGYGRPSAPVNWLLDRLLLVRATAYSGPAELPREVGLAMRGPVLCAVTPTPPPLGVRAVADVDALASHRCGEALALLTSVVDSLGAQPAKAIQSGELGVRDLRRLAKAAETDERTTGRLLEMARSAGLVGTVVTAVPRPAPRGNRWQPDPPPVVEWLPTNAYDAWLGLAPGPRWAALAGAWSDSQAWPSRAGAGSPGGKTTAAFGRHPDATEAPQFRRLVFRLLSGLGVAEAPAVEDLAAAVAWHQFRSAAWVVTDSCGLTNEILAEAELLGLVAGGALSSLGRTFLDDRESAARTVTALLPAAGRQILVQADLTAIAPGPLDRAVADQLSTMADLESRGVATIWRFSEGSVRRALDQGASAENMLDFLDEHASKGVPQPLRYLVNDAARRHGNLRVAAAMSVVTSDDPALLAEVRAARKTAKLRLRELAPTVLASPLASDVVLATLRAAGYLPAQELGDGTVTMSRPERRRAQGAPYGSGATRSLRPATDLLALAQRLLKPGPQRVRPTDNLLGDAGLFDVNAIALRLGVVLGSDDGDLDYDDDYDDDDDDDDPTGSDTRTTLAEAASTGAEVVVLAAAGRRGTSIVGTVAMLTEASVVLRDAYGRKKSLPIDSIVSIMEVP